MAEFKPFSKAKAIREASTSKPCLGTCAARTSLLQQIRNSPLGSEASAEESGEPWSDPNPNTVSIPGEPWALQHSQTPYPHFRDAAVAAAAWGHPLLSHHSLTE